jgi:adenine deaminase
MFCSDDRHPDDLRREHIGAMAVRALRKGHDLFHVLQMACVNPVRHYGLDVGLLRVGDRADFIEVEDLTSLRVWRTVSGGETGARDGRTLLPYRRPETPNRFAAAAVTPADFATPCGGVAEVIEAVDRELVTHEAKVHLPDGEQYDVGRDILKIAVVNRYAAAPVAVAHVRGFGLREGAIASSVAHDSHNVVVVGCSDEAMAAAANRVIEARGGVAAVGGGETHLLALPVAGLMSDAEGTAVADAYEAIDRFVRTRLGSPLGAPFMTLSFMALLVIPELKLSDRGLFDGREFHFVPACRKGEDDDRL